MTSKYMHRSVAKDNSVRCFTVTEPRLHEKGHTVYKVSMKVLEEDLLNNEVTETVMWKRFNDFKTLYKTMLALHKGLHRREPFPPFVALKMFGRFQESVIQERMLAGQDLLNFIGQKPYMVKSPFFQAFIKDGVTQVVDPANDPILQPVTFTDASINQVTLRQTEIDVVCTAPSSLQETDDSIVSENSDSDSLTDVSNLASSTFLDQLTLDPTMVEPDLPSAQSRLFNPKNSSSPSVSPFKSIKNKLKSPSNQTTNSNAPSSPLLVGGLSASEKDRKKAYYIVQAGSQINLAQQYEKNANYYMAFMSYKTGIDVLLRGMQEDPISDRRAIIQNKVERYLSRAEFIFDQYLIDDSKGKTNDFFRPSIIPPHLGIFRRDLKQLNNIRVIGILQKSILVEDENGKTAVMKVLEKCYDKSNVTTTFIANCPRMVTLIAFYETECAIYLLLEYVTGGSILSHILENFHVQPVDEQTDDPVVAVSKPDIYRGVSCDQTQASCSDLMAADTEEPDSIYDLYQESDSYTDSEDDMTYRGQAQEYIIRQESVSTMNPEKYGELEGKMRLWMSQIAVGLIHIHAQGLVIRDLHIGNVLLDSAGDACLTFQRAFNQCDDTVPDDAGELAPECILSQRVTMACDWWAYGAIMYHLFTGQSISSHFPQGIQQHSIIPMPKFLSFQAKDILTQLLKFNPRERLGSAHGTVNSIEVSRHPFFSGIEWPADVTQRKPQSDVAF